VVELGEIVKGERLGRTADDEIVVLSIGGMPVEDMAWASRVLDRARSEDIGTVLPVWDTPELS
jgi:ornithine cyclodeaminase